MIILGIETSCDETAVSVLRGEGASSIEILSEEISSQTKIHEAYGGVVPELASREHLNNLPLLLEKTLNDAHCSLEQIDGIAVTQGPGLKGCLLMGVGFAKGLSVSKRIPLIGVNHIEGHMFSGMIENPGLRPPFLSLVVSGGHTEIALVEGIGRYKILTRTIDDAAGEAFDKAANLLGFQYPGGARLAAVADTFGAPTGRFRLPKVMREADGFSFSGLKTAILLLVKRSRYEELVGADKESTLGDLCATIQSSIVETITFKVEQAVRETGINSVSIAGGVSANRFLRGQIQKLTYRGLPITAYFPSMKHCMDNASMIAYAGYLRLLEGSSPSNLQMEVKSRWPVEEIGR